MIHLTIFWMVLIGVSLGIVATCLSANYILEDGNPFPFFLFLAWTTIFTLILGLANWDERVILEYRKVCDKLAEERANYPLKDDSLMTKVHLRPYIEDSIRWEGYVYDIVKGN